MAEEKKGKKKRYAQVGTGGRARMYYEAIATVYRDSAEIAGFCDISQTRMNYANRLLTEEYGVPPAKTYDYTLFDTMLDEIKPDAVIVTSVDRTHHDYIIRSMEKGYDVITEKPMTIDEKKAQAIIDCQKRTGRSLRVTFNYRYAPHNTKIREIIMDGTIGEVYSIHFEWLLNTEHGADYFRRWHRNKLNSGGLLVHKATHHFDLVNFWIHSQPETVFAFGDLNFYGMKNAERRGVRNFYYRCHGSPAAKGDPFAIDLEANETLKSLYLDAEADSGYIRDRSVFSDDISIEDTMGVMVRYKSNAIMSYSLNAYMPWEGYNVNFNGSKGRLEVAVVEKSYINAGGEKTAEGALAGKRLTVKPMFGKPYEVSFAEGQGGHGGGDSVMLEDIFGDPQPDRFKRAAGHADGAYSILTGIAANKSIASGEPVKIRDLLAF
ncbi:MAG: Gfo/Idh/MocA family oxidoreductase [Spirochaetaceae bacterium]|jgi:predicted dehydrogenase|nr:Gfo/Idh/MocA family oxidoreductase [Spirochaetaceae bacterium]